MCRLWGLLLLVLPLTVVAALPETVARLQSGIVAVGTYQPGQPAVFRGTGFVVGDGRYVATAQHVLPEAAAAAALYIFIGPGLNPEGRQAQIVDIDPEHDLALLRISGPPLTPLRLGNSDSVRAGEDVAFTGYPIGMILGAFPATHRGIVAAIVPNVIPAISSQQLNPDTIRRLRDPYNIFQLDATAYPGNSGSPLYRPDTGQVIGIINKVLNAIKENPLERPSGITYAIPAEHLRALLKQANVAE